MFLVGSLLAGLLAVNGRQDARDQRDAAQAAQADAELDTLVSRSLALRTTNRSVAALLAVEAYRRRPEPDAWSALFGTFTRAPRFAGYQYLPARRSLSGAVIPGTSSAVVALDGRDLRIVDLEDGSVDDPLPGGRRGHPGGSPSSA